MILADPSGILAVTFLVFCGSVNSEVLFRKPNIHEGSVCYLTDKRRGVCQLECPGQERSAYESDVCSRNGTQILYCCLNLKRNASFPNLEKVCMDQRLDIEFLQRLRDQETKADRERRELYEAYERHYQSVLKSCYQQALTFEEDERQTWLSKCLTIPQKAYPPHPVVFRRIYTEYNYLLGMGYKGPYGVFWTCTATLIHENFALTTRDCITDSKAQVGLDLKDFAILRLWHPNLDGSQIEYRIRDYLFYVNMNAKETYFNIAIMKIERLNNGYDFYVRAIPICLWTEEELVPGNGRLTTEGFTNLTTSAVNQSGFFNSSLSLRVDAECQAKQALYGAFSNNTSCVNVTETGAKGCGRGSGIPIHYNENGWLNVPYLFGVGASATFCTQGELGIFERTYPYLEWIENTISENT